MANPAWEAVVKFPNLMKTQYILKQTSKSKLEISWSHQKIIQDKEPKSERGKDSPDFSWEVELVQCGSYFKDQIHLSHSFEFENLPLVGDRAEKARRITPFSPLEMRKRENIKWKKEGHISSHEKKKGSRSPVLFPIPLQNPIPDRVRIQLVRHSGVW